MLHIGLFVERRNGRWIADRRRLDKLDASDHFSCFLEQRVARGLDEEGFDGMSPQVQDEVMDNLSSEDPLFVIAVGLIDWIGVRRIPNHSMEGASREIVLHHSIRCCCSPGP